MSRFQLSECNERQRKLIQQAIAGQKSMNLYTFEEDALIVAFYKERTGLTIDVAELAKTLGRTPVSVSLRASRLGVAELNRPKSESAKKAMSEAQIERAKTDGDSERRSQNTKAWIANNGHPKGMLGKSHAQAAKDKISNANKGCKVPRNRVESGLKTKVMRYGNLVPNKFRGSWKAAWREIGGKRKFYRSRWEANYARYLEFQKKNGLIKEWSHEPETFWFEGIQRGCVSYLPDFKVINLNDSIEYHEVKGWMDAASKTKIKRMAKYHPSVVLKVFDSKWYRANKKHLSGLIKDWE